MPAHESPDHSEILAYEQAQTLVTSKLRQNLKCQSIVRKGVIAPISRHPPLYPISPFKLFVSPPYFSFHLLLRHFIPSPHNTIHPLTANQLHQHINPLNHHTEDIYFHNHVNADETNQTLVHILFSIFVTPSDWLQTCVT